MSEDKLIKTRITGAGVCGVGGGHWERRFVAALDVRKLMSGLCVYVPVCVHKPVSTQKRGEGAEPFRV